MELPLIVLFLFILQNVFIENKRFHNESQTDSAYYCCHLPVGLYFSVVVSVVLLVEASINKKMKELTERKVIQYVADAEAIILHGNSGQACSLVSTGQGLTDNRQ